MERQNSTKNKNNAVKRKVNENENQKEVEKRKESKKTKVEDNEIQSLLKAYETLDTNPTKFESFNDFPLSNYTRRGLKQAHYFTPTDIQKEAITLALKGFDVLGAAKTGSGKTLAFIVPLMECLFREKWTRLDGLGALVITPTRELAYQIFDVINKVGNFHDFSVGLIIGGKDLKFERNRMSKCNIVIGTPGRILQHMNENPLFNCDNLKMLILDEADRILDLGFAQTMNAIIENLPPVRQTLLFSATQTKSVKDLARLSLVDPKFVSVHENAKTTTPESLVQSYIVCELHDKLSMLWSFLKSHRKHKILVFLSTCKQVKYVYELFCRMRPGISLMALYGTLHQLKRMAIYDDFKRKQKAVLFATDIASRGLDFPAVHWVVQLDCPEDVNTYIHRAGRTARYVSGGEALLVLLPSEEESMIEQLEKRKIPINKIAVDPKKLVNICRKAEAHCARDVSLKESAQRAFKAYVKNYFLMKDKTVFDLNKLDISLFAQSLGLEIVPRIRFIEKANAQQRAKELKSVNEKSKKQESLLSAINNSSDDDDLFTVKSIHVYDNLPEVNAEVKHQKNQKVVTKAKAAKRLLKKKINANQKTIFDDEGNPIEEFPKSQTSEKVKLLELKNPAGIDIELAKEIMKDEDKIDKQLYRQLIKAKHKERRLKEKQKKRRPNDAQAVHLNSAEQSEGAEGSEGELDVDTQKYIDELPDPDKIYNSENNSDMNENESEHESEAPFNDVLEQESNYESESDDQERQSSRRESEDENQSNSDSDSEVVLPYPKRRNLLDDEAFALHLLNS